MGAGPEPQTAEQLRLWSREGGRPQQIDGTLWSLRVFVLGAGKAVLLESPDWSERTADV